MRFLSTSFSVWLLIGALAYGDNILIPDEARFFLIAILFAILLTCLILASAFFPASRGLQGGAYYTAATTGFGIRAVYAFVSDGWADGFRRFFWALGGFFGGMLLEASTGFCYACACRLQAALFGSGSESGVSRAAKKD